MHGIIAANPRQSNAGTPKFRSENFRIPADRKLFRLLAKHRFPRKTAPAVRDLTGHPESTIYDWLRGRSAPPFEVYIALLSAPRR
jgi:hypothetical protein